MNPEEASMRGKQRQVIRQTTIMLPYFDEEVPALFLTDGLLAREPDRIFTRSELLDLVWGIDSETAPATVETYISHLRSKVDSVSAARLIQTMRGAGYALRLEAAA